MAKRARVWFFSEVKGLLPHQGVFFDIVSLNYLIATICEKMSPCLNAVDSYLRIPYSLDVIRKKWFIAGILHVFLCGERIFDLT